MDPQEREQILREKIIPNQTAIRKGYVLPMTREVINIIEENKKQYDRNIRENILDLYKPCTL
jgi:hypothetical protein